MAATKKTKVAPKKDAETKKVKNNTHKSDNMAEDNKLMVFLAYFFGIFSIIIYLIKKDDSFVKFHCLQSIIMNVLIVVYAIVMGIISLIFTFVIGILTAGLGGICGLIFVPLYFLPFLYYLYIFYKVLTTGDIEIPYVSKFTRKSLKQYY